MRIVANVIFLINNTIFELSYQGKLFVRLFNFAKLIIKNFYVKAFDKN
jgi:hypothetical protein